MRDQADEWSVFGLVLASSPEPLAEQLPRSLFHIEEATFVGLSRLEKLVLVSTNGGIDALKQEHLKGLDSLRMLHVRGPFVHDIESGAFAHTSKLESLSISHSSLGPSITVV